MPDRVKSITNVFFGYNPLLPLSKSMFIIKLHSFDLLSGIHQTAKPHFSIIAVINLTTALYCEKLYCKLPGVCQRGSQMVEAFFTLKYYYFEAHNEKVPHFLSQAIKKYFMAAFGCIFEKL